MPPRTLNDPPSDGGGVQDGVSGWLADIAANLLCIVVILLVIVGLMAPVAGLGANTHELRVQSRPPQSGAEMVELLRSRLRPAPDGAVLIDLHREGPLVAAPADGGTRSLQPADIDGARLALVYVFGHYGHAALADRLARAGIEKREMTVPEALRTASPGSAAAGWSAAFLALAPRADDPAAFRAALARLLARGGDDGSTGAGAERAGGESSGLWERLAWLRRLGNLVLAGLSAAVVLLVWRGATSRSSVRG